MVPVGTLLAAAEKPPFGGVGARPSVCAHALQMVSESTGTTRPMALFLEFTTNLSTLHLESLSTLKLASMALSPTLNRTIYSKIKHVHHKIESHSKDDTLTIS